MKRTTLALLLGMLTIVISATASAQALDANGNPIEADGEEEEFPVTTLVTVQNTFNAASLLADTEYTQVDSSLLTLRTTFNYQMTPTLTLSASGGVAQHLREEGGLNSQYEGRFNDTDLSISGPLYRFEGAGVNTFFSAGFELPTSDLTRAEGRYTRTKASVTVMRSFGGLNFLFISEVAKNWHEYTSQVLDPSKVDCIGRAGGVENVSASACATGTGVLPEYGFDNIFMANFGFLSDFNFRVMYLLSNSWTYDNGTITEDDEFTNENAVPGRGWSQLSIGQLRLGYTILRGEGWIDMLQVNLAATTVGAPLKNDNSGVRFPFWDLENGQAWRTRGAIGFTGMF